MNVNEMCQKNYGFGLQKKNIVVVIEVLSIQAYIR
jgi:hypothetical protein